MQVGFIGTGSMGSILIEAFLDAKALYPTQLHVANRTFTKAKELAKKYTGLHAYPTNVRVAQRAELIFLCVKPLEFKKVIDDIQPFIHEQQTLVSITSPVEIADLERLLPCKIAKVIPSITNSVQRGATLMMTGERCTEEDKEQLFTLMSSISSPLWIDEARTRISSDIVSCGPAFISYILQQMINAASRFSGMSQEEATAMTSHMVVGLGELIQQEKFTLQTLQERVCVPGGVTGAGLRVLEEELADTFDRLYEETHRKYDEDRHGVKALFYESENKVEN